MGNSVYPLIRDAGAANPRGLAAGDPAIRDPAAADLPGVDSTTLVIPYEGEELAAELLGKVFAGLPGAIAVRLWRGAAFTVGGDAVGRDAHEHSNPRFVLVFRNPQAVCALILGRDPLRLAEAYFRGDMDIEGDLFAALCLKDHLESLKVP